MPAREDVLAEIAARLFPEVGPSTRAILLHDLIPVSTGSDPIDQRALVEIPDAALDFFRAAGSQRSREVEIAETMARARMANSLRVEGAVAQIGRLLTAAGIEAVLLKGMALRELSPHFRARTFNDVDLLVRPEQQARAIAELVQAGFQLPRVQQPRSSFSRRVDHAVELAGPTGISCDLHRYVAPQVWGRRLGTEEIFGASIPGPNGLRLAGATHCALIAAMQIIHDAGRSFRPWRDAALLLWKLDLLDDAMKLAARRNVVAPIAVVVRALGSALERDTSRHASATDSIPRSDLFRLRSLARGSASDHALWRAAELPSSKIPLFLWQYAWPDGTFLREKFGSRSPAARLRWWRDTIGRLRRGEERMVDDSHET